MVHKRFQNMESTFRANERKIRESKARCSGKGTDEIYKPKWDYYDLLSFLKKTCVQTDSIDNLCLQSQSSQSSQSSLFSQEAMSSPISPCSENSSMFINVYYDENAQQYISIPPDSSGSSNIVDTSNNETPSLIHSESYISAEPSLNRSISNTTASSTKQSQSVISNMASRMATPPLRPEGAPIKTKRLEKRSEEPIYVKRGSSKKFNIMEEAVDAIKNMAQQDLSPKTDRFDMLGGYVASRLRSMTSEDQVYYEREILKVLTQRLD
ncbi:uncharacterized protein LOC115243575 [Formica exsecta]|uniref:uncharacterized protein LOC115243575 n=1 Tax=Formica exsecta TaxID=72781 RepID=UPI0011447836|nr:uncharacterized protein LOC115243575 [Formica exsecta]